jgi:shikimate dehydrogenase
MIHLGLLGFPLEHSWSPRMHSVAMESCGLEGDYSLFPIGPENLRGLRDLLARMRLGELTGLNVTIPHKQTLIPLLDELTATAVAIGAVNTIYKEDEQLVGHNTDAGGFLADLEHAASVPAFSHARSALVLGAGGAARAVVYALLNEGWQVTIAARRFDQASELASHFKGLMPMELDVHLAQLSNLQLIVNATSAGMIPNADQSPWPEDVPFPRGAAIYDLVYNPRETKLVRDARAQGLSATTGLGMLAEQAVLAFETWTGRRVRRETLLSTLEAR